MDTAVMSVIPSQSPPVSVEMSSVTISPPKPKEDFVMQCAFCHQVCCSPVKLCGSCKKRAYCSRECQEMDWPVKGPEQCHKNWYPLHPQGAEEDVHWKSIPNQTVGIVAQKLLPVGFKIIIQAIHRQSEEKPSVFSRFDAGHRTYIINHACHPNADIIFDHGVNVLIVYALKEIQPGEEIFINKLPFTGTDRDRPTAGFKNIKEAYRARRTLLREKGIECPPDCFCKDPKVWKLIREGIYMNDEMEELMYTKKEFEAAFEVGEKLLEIQKRLEASLESQASTRFVLFQLAMMKETTMGKALEHLEAAAEIFKDLIPYSKKSRMMLDVLRILKL